MTTSLRSSLHGLALGQKTALTDDDGKVLERIIVGIDFGTTHSAVAWAQTSSPEEYEVITHWPGQTSKDWGKVPSDILYPTSPTSRAASPNSPKLSASLSRPPSTGAGDLIPSTALGFKWGFEVPPTDPQKLSWIKILLDPSQPRPTFVNPKRTTLPRGKKPVDIVTDYLTALRQYTEQTLERRLGRELISRSQVEYVLTVPAVWSDKARQMTMEAAMRAGLGLGNGGGDPEASGGLLKLITEPEGAAEYALRSIQPNSVKVGDCFVVCDAGGGTVDLISYRISSLVPLQLNEVAIGTGALCGAVYLDRRFEDFIITRIGKEQFEAMDHRARFQMVQYWETYVKREFVMTDEDNEEGDGKEGQAEGGEFWVPVMGVPDDEDRGVKGGFLKVTRKDVRDIFEPVVSQVLELISKQVIEVLKSGKGPVAAILLVGGFGSSEYLYQRINKWGSGKITIMQPRNAWTAVVRGAIIRGLQGDIAAVQSRLSRRYYGVVHDSKYDETKHEENEKKWHELRCEWVVRNRIQWYIKRGDVTTEKKKISFPFYRTVAETDLIGDTHQLRTELWVCDEEVAPDKRDPTVRKLCVMTSEPVPVKRFSKHKNGKGQVFYRVDYTLDMTVTSGIVVYEMSLEGEEGTVGRVTTKYE